MILDHLSNAANYFNLHPLFEKAFDFVKTMDLQSAPTGVTEIDGPHLTLSVVETTMRSKKEAQLETHKRFIDIQIPIAKTETFGWKALSALSPSNGYDEANDFELHTDSPGTYIDVTPGEFIIFSPEDAHAPLIGEGETKKIIIKVAVI